MRELLSRYAGIFTPEDVRQMQEEMDRGSYPGESSEDRTQRALRILASARRNGLRTDPLETRKRGDLLRRASEGRP